jgi:oxygen-independent coproporphyrinogen-3 oxidase
MASETRLPAGLYVHVPFCSRKCRYCDFYSIPSASRVPDWLRGIEREARLTRERFSCFDTLYLGGGTPSLLSTRDLDRLLDALRSVFSFCADTEVTLEANPADVTHEKLRTYLGLGFNRLSLGVQSMSDPELAFLGRRHTARRAARVMGLLQESGFPNFGVDLLYGLPGQTEAAWRRTLAEVLAFSPHHVSCYQLTVSPGTPLWEMQRAGLFRAAGEGRERRLFLAASEILEAEGFVHYEVSNYARGPEKSPRVSRHNVKYWERAPYLGLGPSAHSFQGDTRWWNHASVEVYCRELVQGRRPVQGSERLSDEQASLERLALQLRTRKGAPVRELRRFAKAGQVLPGLLAAGYLRIAERRAAPTREGFLVADRLPLLFL